LKKQAISKANFELWQLIGKVSHSILLSRQKELDKHNIPSSQAYVLRVVHELFSKATIHEVAKIIERRDSVIARQTVCLEKDGLIKRIKDNPRSNLFRLELTQKGLDMAEASSQSKVLDTIFLFLSKEDRNKLISILNRILINLDEYTYM
jgi:DNA-binding MarR family transcriptional regulator